MILIYLIYEDEIKGRAVKSLDAEKSATGDQLVYSSMIPFVNTV